jgi:hypothetical protein
LTFANMCNFNTLLTIVLASAASIHAVNVCAHSSTVACAGTSLCCNNIGANQCCGNFGVSFGFSVSYSGLPGPISAGQAWTSGDCRAGGINVAQAGTGNKCFVGGGPTKAGSAAWTHAANKRTSEPAEWVTPDTFSYTVEGLARTIKLPSGSDAVDAVVSLYTAGNFTALEEYEAAE